MKNKILLTVVVCLVSSTQKLPAQDILDWISDPVGAACEYIENGVTEAITGAAHEMWEGFLADDIKNSLSKDAQKIALYPLDSTYLNQLDSTYPKWSFTSNPLGIMQSELKVLPNKYLHYFPGSTIGRLGKGCVEANLNKSASVIAQAHAINQLNQLLNATAMDTIAALNLTSDQSLLFRLKRNPRLAIAFNNHADLVRLDYQWKNTSLWDNPAQLMYWGHLANREDAFLPKKIVLPSGRSLSVADVGVGTCQISSNGIDLAKLRGRDIQVQHIDMMNLHAMPFAEYHVDEILYYTDHSGRVSTVKQNIGKSYKGKCSFKGKLKAKNIVELEGALSGMKPYWLAAKQYHGSESRLNVVPIYMNSANKKVLKMYNKALKMQIKQLGTVPVVYHLIYEGETMYPKEIELELNDQTFRLYNVNG